MDNSMGSNINRKKRFCTELYPQNQAETCYSEMERPKASYKIECLRTFLIQDSNYYGLSILHKIEELLEPYMDQLQFENISIAIMFLLTNKKDSFYNMNDIRIRQVFGDCSFNALQNLYKLAQDLKLQLPSERLTQIIGSHQFNPNWLNYDIVHKKPSQIFHEPIQDYFFTEMVKVDDNIQNHSNDNKTFTMTYNENLAQSNTNTNKNNLNNQYEKYKNILSGLSCEEFCKSMQQILESQKSNDELQNDLFEMLGFDAFELISELLDNRKSIIENSAPQNNLSEKISYKKLLENKASRTTPALTSQILVQSEDEKLYVKQLRKLEKKAEKDKRKGDLDDIEIEENNFWAESNTTEDYDTNLVFAKTSVSLLPKTYPNVYDEQQNVNVKAMICGQLMHIPFDAERKSTNVFDEIKIPSKKSEHPLKSNETIQIESMDKIGKMIFRDIESLNHIQSAVYPTAYHTNENMLICAPTGAGKTNIALLAIVQQIKNFIEADVVKLEKFKIVYVCPMKALAAEMAANFSKKLMPLGVNVRELTGDMQLTRKEIVETQMLVTTPEKWDVITRKGTTDAELTSLLKLLIIDEVHLLNSDRGPVIEALVARTLRQVVNSQNMIRIIGLSATLPNYIDVAHFLRVNPEVGLFFFDGRFRSVPLTQTFVGIKSTKQTQIAIDTDEVCFTKVLHFLKNGHQVMVFVHARNQTSKTANFLKETAMKRNLLHHFEPDKSFKATKASWNATNKALANFLPFGLGIHHAGMLRRDRTEVEKCFLSGAVKVLICTATLAWGVNLPAHAVIIKGTKLYDSRKGSFVDLDILDVMQIFGRAGRPQFDTSGNGIIITTQDKIHFYLTALTNQIPMESRLLNALTDNLNAEIVLRSVSNVQEAVEWMTFTYLYRRMKVNPHVYGLQYSVLQEDPDLRESLLMYIHKAATLLDKAHMIRYDSKTGDVMSTNLGRTASYYYINFDTMEIFNEMMNPHMTEAEIIAMMCLASEFQQIQVRQEELEDLDRLVEEYCELKVPGGVENVHGKVNILMQTYLSRGFIKSLSLASDMEYITQSAARIARALFDIALHQNKALLSGMCLLVAQMFEQQIWPFQTPLRQFKHLEPTVIHNIERFNLEIDILRDMDEKEVGQAIRNIRVGPKVKHCATYFPCVDIDAKIHPITRGVIRVKLFITPNFKWSTSYHGTGCENFWVWVEDPDNDTIYHSESCAVTKLLCMKNEPIELVFTIPLIEPRPSQYLVRVSSDRWMHAVYTHPLSFLDLQLPQSFTPHTDLLELQPLEITVLNNPIYESVYNFSHFNPVQTQIFHCLYHTDNNILLGAPTGSGKTIVAEICVFRLFNNNPELKVVYIAPLKALVRERVDDWKKKFGEKLNKNVVEITGDVTPSPQIIANANIIITTPEKWDGMSRGWQTRNFIRDVGLMIIDEIHLLGEDRGPVLEVIVSRTNFISDRTGRKLRIVGLSTAMANARDLANWLGIREMGLYNFRPSVRPVPLEIHITGFPGKHYCPRMMSMNRPTYQAIRQHAPDSPALVFCSSRKQTRLTAFDLITYLVTDSDPKQWLHCDEDDVALIISNVQDADLRQFLSFGIGIHHAGLQERDRKTVEELFVNQKIQVLIATGTLAWGVNFPAHLVVIKGTEYFDGHIKRYVDMPITDVLQMMGRAGRPQFDTSGVACVFVHDIKKNFYKKFLYEPFPVESNLLQVLPDHINAEIAAETVPTKTNLMEYMTWTYFFRRLLENPSYYDLLDIEPDKINQYLSDLVDGVVDVLANSNCLSVLKEDNIIRYEPTFFGQIASFYYLSHKTMLHFQNSLKYDNTIFELLSIMCHAEEYAVFPVRHNEDKINMQLAKLLNYNMNGLSYDSSHVKVSILLQMYLSDYELPNQEYIVDLKSVLDQALRILQAMIDVASNIGWLSCTLKIIHLIQMLVQGQWMYEPELITLPHINKSNHQALIKELCKFDKLDNLNVDTLAGFKYATLHHKNVVNNALINVHGIKIVEQITTYVNKLPFVNVLLTLVDPENSDKNQVDFNLNKTLQLSPSKEYEFVFNFNRKSSDDKLNVHSKKFPKKKDESWFLCIGCNDELIAVRRVVIRRKSNISLNITTPSILGNFSYVIYVLSDSYLGLDQQYNVPVQIKNL